MERKVRDSKIAQKIGDIVEKDPDIAAKVAEDLEDREAKIYAMMVLYNFSGDKKFLEKALSIAETDEDHLRIIEYSENPLAVAEVAKKIDDPYRKDVAYSILLERTGDLNFSLKILSPRILSAALKRLAGRKPYPENLNIARMIPDPYYRSLALIEIASRYGVELSSEIKGSIDAVKNPSLRRRLIEKY
ncbi:hypothetical protein [Archaeoglobus neptunius]|uniref:hypothetical protein n=1 Tax=Archaeoglobus neptunius TaxID=2798580 RepID=UPI001926DF40|nr:hypothetical protein [Archaeoglobus neptunius]